MTDPNALPTAEQAQASEQQAKPADQLDTSTEQGQQAENTTTEQPEQKPAKTPEQREIDRLRRAIDRRTRQLAEARAAQGQRQQVASTQERQPDTNAASGEDERVSLSRAELDRLVTERAKEIAPQIKQQEAEIEHRRGVVQTLAKEWGQEKFNAYASDLDEALDGLTDAQGNPKPVADAIFESESPKALIEYLADPDHAEEAEALGRMGAVQAGRAIAKLEAKLAAAKAQEKPQRSNAPPPIEPDRGGGKINAAPDPRDTKAWIKHQNQLELARK